MRLVAFALAAGVFALAAPAEAKLGDGIKMGPGRLRLGLELDARFDSMAGLGPYPDARGRLVRDPSDLIARARGVLRYDARPGAEGSGVRASVFASGDWNQYLGLIAETQALSFPGAHVDVLVITNPGGEFSFETAVGFDRSDRLRHPAIATGALSNAGSLKLHPRWRPGGGALELGASYSFEAEGLQPFGTVPSATGGAIENSPAAVSALSSLTNRVGIDAKWRFLPKTGLTLDADFGQRNYWFPTTAAGQPLGSIPGQPIRATLGFGTLLTTKFFFNLRLGYGGILFPERAPGNVEVPALHDVIGQAELGVRVTETFQVRGGFVRSNEPIALDVYYSTSNRAYLDFQAQFSRLVTTAGVSLDFLGFGGRAERRTDQAVSGAIRADYNTLEWLRIFAAASANLRASQGVSTSASVPSAYNFGRFDFTAGVATLF